MFLWCFQMQWPEAQKHRTDMIVKVVWTASSLVSFQVVLRSITSPEKTLGLGLQDIQLNRNAAGIIQSLQACYTETAHDYYFVVLWQGPCVLHAISGSVFYCNLRMLTQAGETENRGLVASEVLRNPGELVIMMVTNLVHWVITSSLIVIAANRELTFILVP